MKPSRPGSLLVALAAAAAMMAGCGSGQPGTPDALDIGCQNDTRAMTYTANMQLQGVSKFLTFVLEQSVPAPPIKGTNTWTLKVLDGSAQPVSDASLTVKPFMPDHGHGTSVVPQVAPAGDAYTISNLYLFMAGLWQVTITVTTPSGTQNDAAVFSFCVEG